MKKFKIMLSMTLLLLTTISSVAYAKTFSTKENLRGSEYVRYMDGSYSKFCAVGQSGKAYSTLTNTSNSTYYLDTYTRVYTYETGWSNYVNVCAQKGPGQQVISQIIDRDKNNKIVYYFHSGKCCISPYYTSTIDDYTFKANQYYE